MKMLPQPLRNCIRQDVFSRLFGSVAQTKLIIKNDALCNKIHQEEHSLTSKPWVTGTEILIGPSPTDTLNFSTWKLPVTGPGDFRVARIDPEYQVSHRVQDPQLIIEGKQLLAEIAMFRRRYQSAEAFLNRLMAQCSHSSQFHQYHVKAYKDAGLYNSAVYGWVDSLTEKHREVFKVNEYHEVPEERIQEFMAQEKEAIDALNNHVFLTKLIG